MLAAASAAFVLGSGGWHFPHGGSGNEARGPAAEVTPSTPAWPLASPASAVALEAAASDPTPATGSAPAQRAAGRQRTTRLRPQPTPLVTETARPSLLRAATGIGITGVPALPSAPSVSAAAPAATRRAAAAAPAAAHARARALVKQAPQLVLRATGASWFQVKRSGKLVAVGTLKTGGTRTFSGAGSYDIVLGNAGHVLVANGSTAAHPGADGHSAVLHVVVR